MRHSIVPIVMQQIKDDITFADYDSQDNGFVDSLTFLYAGPTVYGDQDAGTDKLWETGGNQANNLRLFRSVPWFVTAHEHLDYSPKHCFIPEMKDIIRNVHVAT